MSPKTSPTARRRSSILALSLFFLSSSLVSPDALAAPARSKSKATTKEKEKKPSLDIIESTKPLPPEPPPSETQSDLGVEPLVNSASNRTGNSNASTSTSTSPAATTPPAEPSIASTTSTPAKSEKPKLIVLGITPSSGVEPKLARAMTDAMTSDLAQRGFFDVVSSSDVETLLGVERQRQMLGCSEQSCMSELAGALGARFVMSGALALLGSTYQLNVQTLDTFKAQPIGRSTRLAKDLDSMRRQLAYVAAEATATPPPTPPSRVLPITLMSVGAAAIVGGGVVAFQALSSEAAVNRELSRGETVPGILKPLSDYQAEKEQIARTETVALSALIVGAVLLGVGIAINPPEGSTVTTAYLVPTHSGMAIVGGF